MLDAYVKSEAERGEQGRDRIAKLRREHTETEAGITRLLALVEQGLMDTEDAALRERLVALKLKRNELAKGISDLQRHMASGEPSITPEKVGRIAVLLRDKLHSGPPELRQAYARLLMEEARVTDEEIRISGSKAVLAWTAWQGF